MPGGTGQYPKTKATPEEVAASLGNRDIEPPRDRRSGARWRKPVEGVEYRPNADLSKVRRHP